MNNEKELNFLIFLLYALSEKWNKLPAEVYTILNESKILDDYIIPCYDTLHTQGRQALVKDITDFIHEKEISI